MVKINKIAATVIGLSVLIGLSPFIADEVLLEKQTLDFETNATVIEEGNFSLGVVAEPHMRFGRIPAGSGSTKFLNVSAQRDTILSIDAEGNISEYLEYPEQTYFQGAESISVHFNTSESTPLGHYSGTLTVKTETTTGEISSRWLETKYWFYQLY